ncbi:hypothetical protein BC829DRAFT_419344 [Chytridium lagenaria]|nr:hypothetical protein BC829DRAFT_419344 [Chytridium lagenaria]
MLMALKHMDWSPKGADRWASIESGQFTLFYIPTRRLRQRSRSPVISNTNDINHVSNYWVDTSRSDRVRAWGDVDLEDTLYEEWIKAVKGVKLRRVSQKETVVAMTTPLPIAADEKGPFRCPYQEACSIEKRTGTPHQYGTPSKHPQTPGNKGSWTFEGQNYGSSAGPTGRLIKAREEHNAILQAHDQRLYEYVNQLRQYLQARLEVGSNIPDPPRPATLRFKSSVVIRYRHPPIPQHMVRESYTPARPMLMALKHMDWSPKGTDRLALIESGQFSFRPRPSLDRVRAWGDVDLEDTPYEEWIKTVKGRSIRPKGLFITYATIGASEGIWLDASSPVHPGPPPEFAEAQARVHARLAAERAWDAKHTTG